MTWQIKLHSWTMKGTALPNKFDLHEGDLEGAKKVANKLFALNPGCPKEVIIYDPAQSFMRPAARYDNFKKTMPGWTQHGDYQKQRGFI